MKYWIFGAKAGGSESTSFSRKIERSTSLRGMGGLLVGCSFERREKRRREESGLLPAQQAPFGLGQQRIAREADEPEQHDAVAANSSLARKARAASRMAWPRPLCEAIISPTTATISAMVSASRMPARMSGIALGRPIFQT